MKFELLHYGTFELTDKGPKFVPDDPTFFRLNAEGLIGKRVQIDMREARRSNEFNAYYWAGVVKTFTDYFNQNKTFQRVIDLEWTHELLAAKFLGFSKQTLPGGEVIEMRNKSSKLSTQEFKDFVEYCKQWGTEFFGLTFPEKT